MRDHKTPSIFRGKSRKNQGPLGDYSGNTTDDLYGTLKEHSGTTRNYSRNTDLWQQ
jgi:hypothetical protein